MIETHEWRASFQITCIDLVWLRARVVGIVQKYVVLQGLLVDCCCLNNDCLQSDLSNFVQLFVGENSKNSLIDFKTRMAYPLSLFSNQNLSASLKR